MKISAQAFNIGHHDQSGEIEKINALNGGAQSFGGPIVVPGGAWPLNAEFVRQGPDLLISGHDGESFVVRDYFFRESAADIQTEGGAVLPGAIVERLTGPLAPGQFAQTNNEAESDIVGRVETVLGNATALRVDGTQVELTAGDPIMAGDVLQTAAEASLGVVFADKTTMSLGEEGRLVVDDFVYDPQANAGGMSINIVQGVFTFVSGEIAKIGPDTMTVYTPVATVGIRGTKVAGRAAAEGEQNTISLLPNEDGTVGVIAVGNQSGAAPQILTNAGATTTVNSQFQAPAPQIVYSQAQIQQQYGNALQTLDAAQQSVQTRQENQPDQSGDQQGEAAPGEGEGAETEQEASGTPEPEGEGVSEEEQAARDAADAAARDGETPEGALEAAIEAAADRALAEGASPEEVAEAEAEARDAYNEALANGESPEAALEAAMASVGEAEFSQLAAGAPGGQEEDAPSNVQLGRGGPGNEGQEEVLGAAESAAETALAEGASEEEAFNAAVQAAMDAAIARGEDPAVAERIAADVREAYADAIESGVEIGAAMQLAFNTAGEEDRGFGDPLAPLSPGGGDDVIALGPLGGPDGVYGSFFGGQDYFSRTLGPELGSDFGVLAPLIFDAPEFDPIFDNADAEDDQNNIISTANDDVVFTETITLTDAGGPFEGTSGNTEFIFDQNTYGSGSAPVVVTDLGGGSDRVTFENLDGVAIRMGELSSDTNFIQVDIFNSGGSVSANTLSAGGGAHELHLSRDIEDLQGSLSGLNSGVIIKNALETSGSETAFILAGTSSDDTLNLNVTDAVGALIFGRGGNDTINLTGASTDHLMFGGAGTDTVDYSNMITFNGMAQIVLLDFNSGAISVTHTDSKDTFSGIESVIASTKDDFLVFEGANATGGFQTVSGGSGTDRLIFEGGISSAATINGGNDADIFLFTDLPSSAITIGDFTTTSDSLVFNLNGGKFLGHDGIGGLSSGNFINASSAGDSDDFFIYDGNDLFYDADGIGSASAQIKVATVGASLAIGDIKFADVQDVSGSVTATINTSSNVDNVVIASDTADVITLSGLTEAGDVFDGGDGSDTLNLDNGANTITVFETETVNGGSGVDQLTLFGLGGSAVTGGSGGDTITLSGGSDIIRYGQTSEGSDTVNGFVSDTDFFAFNGTNFVASNSSGILDANAFVSGSGAVAADADDRFIFDTSTNVLSFDDDGIGGNAAVVIATLDNSSLQNTDITFF